MSLERIIDLEPAFDKRSPDPDKNCGIHGCSYRLVLKGLAGAVQFLIYSNRHLPHVQDELVRKLQQKYGFTDRTADRLRSYAVAEDGLPKEEWPILTLLEYERYVNGLELGVGACILRPMAADLGYHSPVPMHDGQEPMRHLLKKAVFGRNEDGPLVVEPAVYGDPSPCPYLDGPCYFDGSGLAAQKLYATLVLQNEEAVWEALEERYNSQFGEP